jgi:hypothetical protein
MTDDEIYNGLVSSPYVSTDFLRSLLGPERTGHIHKAEVIPEVAVLSKAKDKIDNECVDLEELDNEEYASRMIEQAKAKKKKITDELKPIKDAYDSRVAEELKLIRNVMSQMTRAEIVRKYREWGDSKLRLQTNLPPFKAYKSVGRQVVLNPEHLSSWDKYAFIAVLSRRWIALMDSPIEARLFCMSPDHYTEASKDDALWAFKLNGRKLDRPWFETGKGRAFIFAGLEEVASQQYTWLETLKEYCAEGTSAGDDSAFEFLTSGTLKVKRRLGLTQTLMKELWTGEIRFSERLIRKLKETFMEFGIRLCDFQPPRLVHSDIGDDFTIIKNIGKEAVVPG